MCRCVNFVPDCGWTTRNPTMTHRRRRFSKWHMPKKAGKENKGRLQKGESLFITVARTNHSLSPFPFLSCPAHNPVRRQQQFDTHSKKGVEGKTKRGEGLPFFSSFHGYVQDASRHRSTGPQHDRFRASSRPERTLFHTSLERSKENDRGESRALVVRSFCSYSSFRPKREKNRSFFVFSHQKNFTDECNQKDNDNPSEK